MKKYILSLACVGIILGSIGAAVGLSIMSSNKDKADNGSSPPSLAERIDDAQSESYNTTPPAIIEQTPEPVRIKPTTKIMYEHFYPAGNRTETNEKDPPYFLLDQPRDKIADYYVDWDIVEFNENQVKLRRTIPELPEDQFVLGIKDNYVAVYQRSHTGSISLKEITGTPIGALSQDEQTKLMAGISITCEDHLAKMLEDYGS